MHVEQEEKLEFLKYSCFLSKGQDPQEDYNLISGGIQSVKLGEKDGPNPNLLFKSPLVGAHLLTFWVWQNSSHRMNRHGLDLGKFSLHYLSPKQNPYFFQTSLSLYKAIANSAVTHIYNLVIFFNSFPCPTTHLINFWILLFLSPKLTLSPPHPF